MFDKSWPFSADPARCLQVAHFNSFSVSRYKGPARFDEAQVRKDDPSKVLKRYYTLLMWKKKGAISNFFTALLHASLHQKPDQKYK